MILYGAEGLTARDQAHRLLALAAAEHWGLSPLPALDRAEHGKPFFPGLPERQFNLSHSGPLALCALDRRPVGVDIQTVGPHRPRILQRVCSREERAWLDEQSDLWAAFAQLWALKESRAKYTGAGLTSPIAEIRVPITVHTYIAPFLEPTAAAALHTAGFLFHSNAAYPASTFLRQRHPHFEN